jgi:hypothetical protein
MPDDITYTKMLAQDSGHINLFLDTINQLDIHKGCVLIQFPGKIA